MRKQKADYVLLIVSVVSFFMLSISFLLMPIENKEDITSLSTTAFFAGIMFWVSVVLGIVTQVVISVKTKKWLASNNVKIKKGRSSKKPGIISFFKNTLATIADIAMFISLLGLVISIIATQGIAYICYIFLALFVFTFSMHCILNGKSYYIISNKNKILRSLQKESVKSEEV